MVEHKINNTGLHELKKTVITLITCALEPQINNMFLRHCFSENDVEGLVFIF